VTRNRSISGKTPHDVTESLQNCQSIKLAVGSNPVTRKEEVERARGKDQLKFGTDG
jgi:hypothetical protein